MSLDRLGLLRKPHPGCSPYLPHIARNPFIQSNTTRLPFPYVSLSTCSMYLRIPETWVTTDYPLPYILPI